MRRRYNDKRGGIFYWINDRSYWEHGVALYDRNYIGGNMSKKTLIEWRNGLSFKERAELRKLIAKLKIKEENV